MACGGSMTLFYEPVSSKRLLTIFGAGHVGRALARVAYEAGWSIRVVDDRDGIFDNSFFPKQTECVAAPYIDFIQNQQFSENDWLAIVTPKHSYDESVLRAVIASQAKYIGMMGSPKKVKEVMAKLNSDGIYENLLKKVYAPIGLNIGTETPSEIAIAIVGEMLALLHGISEIKFCSR
jgi:xanthine dehydrogenase accessory factor